MLFSGTTITMALKGRLCAAKLARVGRTPTPPFRRRLGMVVNPATTAMKGRNMKVWVVGCVVFAMHFPCTTHSHSPCCSA
jgi:hypothetical protein